MHLGDQDKPIAPHIYCKICTVNLHRWNNKKIFKFQNTNNMDRRSESCIGLLFLHGKY